jgi:hypothetical protein
MAAGGGEDVGWAYCLDDGHLTSPHRRRNGCIYMGRNEALQAFGNDRHDTHTFGFDLIYWFGLTPEWEESERVLLYCREGARYHHPPGSRLRRGNRLKENYTVRKWRKTYPYIHKVPRLLQTDSLTLQTFVHAQPPKATSDRRSSFISIMQCASSVAATYIHPYYTRN